MSITGKAHRAILEGIMATTPVTPDFRRRDLPVNLIVMSHDTAQAIRREQMDMSIVRPALKTEPDRIYGVRIAYDDSLALGQFLAAFTRKEPE
jgi:hypothetical protein